MESTTIRRQLSDWREIILLAKSVLIWEETIYMGVIFGLVTGIYILIWLFDPSILTLLSILGMIVVSADYFVPRIMSQIFDEQLVWTGEKEKKYDMICEDIAYFFQGIRSAYFTLSHFKESWPVTHFILTAAFLLSISWLGNCVNNTLLFYIWSLCLSFLPGLIHRGFIRKYAAWSLIKFAELIKGKIGVHEKKE